MSNTYSVYRDQKSAVDPMELELQVVMNHPKWVLEAKLRYSTRTASKSQSYLCSTTICNYVSPFRSRVQHIYIYIYCVEIKKAANLPSLKILGDQ